MRFAVNVAFSVSNGTALGSSGSCVTKKSSMNNCPLPRWKSGAKLKVPVLRVSAIGIPPSSKPIYKVRAPNSYASSFSFSKMNFTYSFDSVHVGSPRFPVIEPQPAIVAKRAARLNRIRPILPLPLPTELDRGTPRLPFGRSCLRNIARVG